MKWEEAWTILVQDCVEALLEAKREAEESDKVSVSLPSDDASVGDDPALAFSIYGVYSDAIGVSAPVSLRD